MNSLALPTPFQLSTDTSHWDEVRRIYRRILVLRATGRDNEAAVLENRDLQRALLTARGAAESDAEEPAVLAAEAERVLNASLTAEILAPLLAERLASALPSHNAAPIAQITPALAISPEISSQPAPAATAPRRKSEAVPSIADLIDGMLSQEA